MTEDATRPSPHFIKLDQLDRAALDGLYGGDISQYLKITKFTIQKYLEACIHPQGQFRKFFNKFATFTTNYVVNEALSQDPDARHLQISRYYSSMRERPPQIFIQDQGYEYKPASLGSLSAGWNMRTSRGEQIVRIVDVIPIQIEITCAATSEQEIEDLSAFASAAFGQLQRFTSNYILSPPRNEQGVYWEVRIPLTHNMSSKSHAPLHQDPRIQIWQTTCTMTVDFENSTYITYNARPKAAGGSGSLSLTIPDTIPFRNKTRFQILKMPYPVNVFSDDSSVALIRPDGTHYMVLPKRLGKFNIVITKKGVGAKEAPLLEKEITINAR